MKITVDNKEFHIHFAYERIVTEILLKMSGIGGSIIERTITHCHIHEGSCSPVSDHGRCTTAHILSGKSVCSERDQFSKVTGRKIAMSRALHTLPRKERAKFWEEYFKLSPKSKNQNAQNSHSNNLVSQV